jgi:caa(3)-type oxidase subunit IV
MSPLGSSAGAPIRTRHPAPVARLLRTGGCLLLLAAASYGLSFWTLGALSLTVALAIAALKALTVLFVFMEFGGLSNSAKLAALAALFMLALLAALMAADIGTREPSPQVLGVTRRPPQLLGRVFRQARDFGPGRGTGPASLRAWSQLPNTKQERTALNKGAG